MREVGFTNFTVTSIDAENPEDRLDAESLPYADKSRDVVIVHAGLHHCHSPHRALLEMYRVARNCAIAFEARDSLLVRAAVKIGLTMDYELNAVDEEAGTGGVANSAIPKKF